MWPAEITGRQPRGPLLGTPTPDAGYALLLAGRVDLADRERLDDALWAGAIIGMKRAGLVGRGPILADVKQGFALLGYLSGAPPDMIAWRRSAPSASLGTTTSSARLPTSWARICWPWMW